MKQKSVRIVEQSYLLWYERLKERTFESCDHKVRCFNQCRLDMKCVNDAVINFCWQLWSKDN